MSTYYAGDESLQAISDWAGANFAPIDSTDPDSAMSDTSTNAVQNQVIKAYVDDGLADKANLASPALTGTPTVPTATTATDTTQIASTAFVHNAIDASIDSALDTTSANAVQNSVVASAITSLQNQTPTLVATVAEMTDTSHIYVYTGSETGYTAGHWYYYNGSAWVSGGAYGGASVDSAMSNSSTNPVQNKVINAELTDIKEDLLHLADIAFREAEWSKLQYYTRTGQASSYVSVGDQISDTYTDPDASSTTEYSQVWDVLDFRNVTLSDASVKPATIIGTHYTQLVSQQFSSWQALLYTATGLPAGTYNFTIDTAIGTHLTTGTYQPFPLC